MDVKYLFIPYEIFMCSLVDSWADISFFRKQFSFIYLFIQTIQHIGFAQCWHCAQISHYLLFIKPFQTLIAIYFILFLNFSRVPGLS